MALDAPAGNPINPDQWDGYKAEQQDILDSARRRKVKDIAFLTGDIHTFFAGQVTPSGRQPGQPQPGGPVATEFVSGSITSDGLADSVAREPLKAPAGQAPGRAERLQRARQQPPHRVLEPGVQGLRREVSVFALDASGWVRKVRTSWRLPVSLWAGTFGGIPPKVRPIPDRRLVVSQLMRSSRGGCRAC